MAYYREAISLPMFQGLTDEQQNTVVAVLTAILSNQP
jgi:dTDP-4-amino-4,6-dideoxygalactose transaminase